MLVLEIIFSCIFHVFPYIKYDDLLLWKTFWSVCCFLSHFRPFVFRVYRKEAQAQNWSIHSGGNHRRLWSIFRIWNKFNFWYFKGSFGKTLEFCWGLKGGISYEIIIIHWHLFNRELFYTLLACKSIRNAYPTEFFPIVSWLTHFSRNFWFLLFWN